jgi:hypothetical protein
MRTTLAIATLLAARLLASSPPEANPEKTLEAAIYQAKVLGNLPGAIKQLESIAAENAGQPVAGRALVELGQAEEQLGDTERARAAYTRVLKEYAGQVQLVAAARQGLAAIAEAPAGPRNLSFEQGEPGKVPDGWFVEGWRSRQGYSAELRRTGCHGTTGCAVVLVPATHPVNGFGNLMQSFSAAGYRGMTVRLHAWLRVDAVSKGDTAQLWLRVDGPNQKMGFFDNMHDRPVRSAAWTEAQIVGKVADDAETINFGVISEGAGSAWVDSVTFEVVAGSTPTTGMFEAHNMPKEPVNLSLEAGETGGTPAGWLPNGKVEVAHQGCHGAVCASIRLAEGSSYQVATLSQIVNAASYRGKTVRLRAWLRLDATIPDDSAQMWFGVVLPGGKMGAVDNMENRPVKSAEWTQAEIVAKVEDDADKLTFGVVSTGKGKAWVDGLTFEIVPDGTPVTAKAFVPYVPAAPSEAPRNLDFAQGEPGKAPEGWVTGAGRSELSRQGCHGSACAAVWLEPDSQQTYANLMQPVNAASYRGKTVRLRAWLKLDAAAAGDKAQMWLRVGLPNGRVGAFDNMDDRPVKSSVWTQAEIVAKVAADAETIDFGVLSVGKGKAWVDGVTFEVVPGGTRVTAKSLVPSEAPQNLNFAQSQTGKAPGGWITEGRSEVSRQGCHGSVCAALWVEPNSVETLGILTQTINAAPYRGKTIRLRAWLRLDASAATDKARMWVRVELSNGKAGAYDNMDDRPVQSAEWTQAEIVARVAADAETINFGAISMGKGKAWVDGVTLEVVPDGTPSTGKRKPQL